MSESITEFRDLLGRIVSEGEHVIVYNYNKLKVGKIIGFSKKRVRIEHRAESGKSSKSALYYANEFVKMSDEDYTFYILTKS